MSSYQAPPQPRPTKLGRYELIGHLATGGMAEIHLARLAGEAGFEKVVVVKRLLPELVASREFVDMFVAEGKLVARLDHPNVCEVHELGRDGPEYFLAMPFLDGVPVSDLIARPREADRIAELRVAAAIVVQACAGLHHAHELRATDGAASGLVHRDVSPSNLFATASGIVKVLDFGIAKVHGAGTATEAGTVKGKTQYMAPEQLLGEPLDRRCDVFALGIVLFELATHQRLFKRASDFLVAKAILEEPIARADAVDPAIPALVADVIARALARDRASRFPDARALGDALAAAMRDLGGLATADEIARAIAVTDELTTRRLHRAEVIAAITRLERPVDHTTRVVPRPRRRTPIAVAVAIAAIAAIAIFASLHSDPTVPVPLPLPLPLPLPPPPLIVAVAPPPDAAAPDAAPPPPPDASPPIPKPGTLSIDSTPYAKLTIDNHPAGITPLLKHPLAAGRHRIHAALVDGRTRDLVVDVPAGRAAPPLVLTW